MKYTNHNIFKYIFVFVVIALVIGAVYILYYSNKKDVEVDEEYEVVNEVTSEISIVENLKMGISSFDTMNPLLTKNKEIININKLIFEPLVNITSDYKTENNLAKSIEKVSDTQYKVKIDTNVKWQDGSSLISKDIEYTVSILKSIDSIYSSNVQAIANVEVLDSETVIINLSYPVQFFEYYLDFPIVSSAYYMNEDFVNSSKIPIGTGMYKIASIDNDNILLIRNDRWRLIKQKTPKTQSITIHKYNVVGEAYNAFKMGNVDIINTYLTNYQDYVGTMGYNKKEYVARDFDFVTLNCNDSILSDKSVRQALTLGISKENIVSSVLGNRKVASYSPLAYGSYLYNREGELEYNQDKAKKVLEENGWIYTNDRWQKTIDGHVRKLILNLVVCNDNGERISVAQNIKEQLDLIGIKVNVVQVNRDKYNEYLREKNYQLLLTGVTNSINPDFSYFYGENNLANYNNQELKDKINNLDKIKENQKIINDDCPYIGLYRNKGIVLLNANVGGNFEPNSYFTYYNFNEWFRQQ